MGCIAQLVGIRGNDLDLLASAILPYLNSKQPQSLQNVSLNGAVSGKKTFGVFEGKPFIFSKGGCSWMFSSLSWGCPSKNCYLMGGCLLRNVILELVHFLHTFHMNVFPALWEVAFENNSVKWVVVLQND